MQRWHELIARRHDGAFPGAKAHEPAAWRQISDVTAPYGRPEMVETEWRRRTGGDGRVATRQARGKSQCTRSRHDGRVTTRSRPGDDAAIRARQLAGQFAAELRDARLASGLSLEAAARSAGISPAQLSRIERNILDAPSIEQLWRAAAPLGLRGFARLYPAGSPVRDRAHLAVLERFERIIAPPLRLIREVPLPLDGDLRAWDGMIIGRAGRCFVEVETHLRDMQAMDRRISAKLRDDPRSDTVVLVVMRSAHNRDVLRDHRESMRGLLPLDGAAIHAVLRGGQIPRTSGVVML